MRQLLSDALTELPDIVVVGTASNGKVALPLLSQSAPDVVLLDVEMPVMDGLATLAALRRVDQATPVIMVSAHTKQGSPATIEALLRGASDYYMKPVGTGDTESMIRALQASLVPKIRALASTKADLPDVINPPVEVAHGPRRKCDVVAIGVSTGGPAALGVLLRALPQDFPVPIVIVQHMPAMLTRHLANDLAGQARLTIREAEEGMYLAAGNCYIAPGDFHMEVSSLGTRVGVHLHQKAPVNHCRPSADVLFRTVAQVYGERALALVLTGMGADGMQGSELIRKAGGTIWAQDRATSVVWGMPGAVVNSGLATRVLPISKFADALVEVVRAGRTPS